MRKRISLVASEPMKTFWKVSTTLTLQLGNGIRVWLWVGFGVQVFEKLTIFGAVKQGKLPVLALLYLCGQDLRIRDPSGAEAPFPHSP